MELTVCNIWRTLAGNIRDFASRASHCSHNPRQIEIRSLEKHADQCIANANFCFQITAIDGDSYSKIRELIHDTIDALRLLRRAHEGKDHLIGCALADFKAALVEKINRLWGVINFITEAEKDERWARHVSSQLKATN